MLGGGGSYSYLVVPLVIGAVMSALRLWMFYAGSSAMRSARRGRIAGSDAHLSFDERIAERMRELDRETRNAAPLPPPPIAASPPPTMPTGTRGGFGRRQP